LGQKRYAMRLHRQGYRTDQELWSELQWMAAVAAKGCKVPAPIPSTSGAVLQLVDDVQVDVLTWLDGVTIADAIAQSSAADRAAMFAGIGREMARLHQISDNWQQPSGFTRCAWDRNGLLGPAPLWGRFWDNPALNAADKNLMLAFRRAARQTLEQAEQSLDYGLIHADLVGGNMMTHAGHLQLIDFDDGGFGFRIFDIATALLKQMCDPDYDDLRASLISGYISIRPINLDLLGLFMALRAVTYVGWNITRMAEPGGAARNARFIAAARNLAAQHLEH